MVNGGGDVGVGSCGVERGIILDRWTMMGMLLVLSLLLRLFGMAREDRSDVGGGEEDSIRTKGGRTIGSDVGLCEGEG